MIIKIIKWSRFNIRYSFFLFWLVILSCSNPSDSKPKKYWIEFEVTGTTPAVDITVKNEDGLTYQYDDAALPWSFAFGKEVKKGQVLYIYVQRSEYQAGTIVITIYKNGEVYKQSSSQGYSISVSGVL